MQQAKRLILGIDPGSRCTGYGIIWTAGSQRGIVCHNFIRCRQNSLGQRLYTIYQQLVEIIQQYQPHEAAIEQVFTFINPQAALKLGQARGAALTAVAQYAISIAEYSPREIKKSVVGYGAAEKSQIQHMVRALLKLTHNPQEDAADALAIALCHAQHQQRQLKLKTGAQQ